MNFSTWKKWVAVGACAIMLPVAAMAKPATHRTSAKHSTAPSRMLAATASTSASHQKSTSAKHTKKQAMKHVKKSQKKSGTKKSGKKSAKKSTKQTSRKHVSKTAGKSK